MQVYIKELALKGLQNFQYGLNAPKSFASLF